MSAETERPENAARRFATELEQHHTALEEAAAEAERDVAALVQREGSLTTALAQTREERHRATGGLMLARKLLAPESTEETPG